jgi:hypothetical protein
MQENVLIIRMRTCTQSYIFDIYIINLYKYPELFPKREVKSVIKALCKAP